jgi:signal transduction histidine kinase
LVTDGWRIGSVAAPGLLATVAFDHPRGWPHHHAMADHTARSRHRYPGRDHDRSDEEERAHLEEMAFLAEVAHLAATARTWDELMGTVIDRAKAAARADVCSLYLTDRDGSGLTLAATNGLDQEAVGVARLAMGQGITGLAGKTRRTIVSPDVHRDERFAWIRGVDQARFISMCSVPLVWDEQVIGVLNVQTVEPREFSPASLSFLETLAGLLAALIEKERLHAEAAAQIESLRAIDEARANLVAVVTHALRTPLAVVRAYVELLGDQARRSDRVEAGDWEREALAQVDRIDRTVDSILESLRVMPVQAVELSAVDLAAVVAEVTREVAPMLRRHSLTATFPEEPLVALASTELLHRLLGYLLENASKYAPAGGRIDIYGWRGGDRAQLAITDDGPGIPEAWRERIFEPFVRLDDSPRGAGIGLFAARHLARAMGGELRVEPREPHGSQFVLELGCVGLAPAAGRRGDGTVWGPAP